MRYMFRLAILACVGLLIAGLPRSASAAGPGTWSATGNLVAPEMAHTSTVLPDGRVFVFGTGSAQIYDPATGTWSSAGSPGAARAYHTATLLPDGTVLIAGGGDFSTGTIQADLYDPATGSWRRTGNMAVARTQHTATLLPSGKVLVAGGCCDATQASQTSLNSAEVYDPATGAWHMVGSMSGRRNSHTATLLSDGTVLVTGGYFYRTGTVGGAEVFDPSTESWHGVGGMTAARGSHTATRLADGRVLVTGGSPGGCCSGLATAEIYNPAAGSWSTTSSMAIGRKYHRATLLTDGRVLITGGYSCCSTPDPVKISAELYDPATGSWSSAGNMSHPRYLFAASLLRDGRVLVSGGDGTDGGSASSADLYAPNYALTIGVAGSGTVTGSAPGLYSAGSAVTLTANPAAGQAFTGWTVNGASAGNANPLTLTVNADLDVIAHFEVAVPCTAPAARFTPDGLDFGPQRIGTKGSAPVVLRNTGCAPLHVHGIYIAGSDPGSFFRTHDCPSRLAAGASCTITVTFQPRTRGDKSATLTVRDNAAGSPHTVSLSGTAWSAGKRP